MVKVLETFQKTKNLFIDLLFPKFCVGCSGEGEWLCSKCAQNIVPVVSQVCPKCGKLNAQGRYHVNCRKGIALKGIIAAAYFEEGPVREMIHNFKYNGVTALGENLSVLMANALARNFQLSISNFQSIPNDQLKNFTNENYLKTEKCKIENYILTFVPLHWRRQAQRGYNQAELLAEEVAKLTGLKTAALLEKRKSTKRQAELSSRSRQENLKNAFFVKTPISLVGKKVILIDDVTTTGSTLNECAKVLKEAGAKEIWGLVIARG